MSNYESQLPDREMLPVPGLVDAQGYGRYEMGARVCVDEDMSDAEGNPSEKAALGIGGEQPSVVDPQILEFRHVIDKSSRFRRFMGRSAMLGAAAAVIIVGAKNLPNFFSAPKVLPDAHHEMEIEIEAPETIVVHDTSINFAEIESHFGYRQHTSLNRWGPSNCDMTINDEARTRADAEITVEKAEITTQNDQATIKITGIVDTETFFNADDGILHIDMASGSVDLCRNRREVDWANFIAYGGTLKKDKSDEYLESEGVLKKAGEVATACAIQQEGQPALDEAIKHQARVFSEKLDGIDPDNIEVEYIQDFDEMTEAQVNRATAELYKTFNDLAEEYFRETDDHTRAVLNASDLIDCDEHDITVKR